MVTLPDGLSFIGRTPSVTPIAAERPQSAEKRANLGTRRAFVHPFGGRARGGFSGFIIQAGGGGSCFPLGTRSPFERRSNFPDVDSGGGGGRVSGTEAVRIGLSLMGAPPLTQFQMCRSHFVQAPKDCGFFRTQNVNLTDGALRVAGP